MDVHFSPNQPNKHFVSIMSRKPEFRNCNFLPLGDDQKTRFAQLQQIKGPAAFIWGDGLNHHDSFYFTRGEYSDVKLKVNLDRHDDTISGHAKTCEFGAKPEVNFANHMTVSELEGLRILTMKPCISHSSNQLFYDLVQRTMRNSPFFGENEIAVSVDADVLVNFPCVHPAWIKETGMPVQQIVGLIKKLAGKISRFDLGGIHELAPQFSFTENREIPEARNSISFAFESRLLAQDEINFVGSYAFTAYKDILGAFVQSQE